MAFLIVIALVLWAIVLIVGNDRRITEHKTLKRKVNYLRARHWSARMQLAELYQKMQSHRVHMDLNLSVPSEYIVLYDGIHKEVMQTLQSLYEFGDEDK